MNPEDVERFETLRELFLHPGWPLLVEELETNVESMKEQLTYVSVGADLTNFLRGRIIAVRDLIGYQNIIDAALKDEQTNSV